MRKDITPEMRAAIEAAGITTALACRLDFRSGSVFVWTGMHPIQPTGSGDSLLDGNIFDPLAYGVVVDIGENTYSLSGSDALPITLNVPSSPDITIAAAQTYPNEYQSRPAIVWRAIRIDTGNPLAEPVWAFRRIRAGTMDKVEVQADGTSHRFILNIESHVGRISNASNQTYLNQRTYDPNDSSQDFAAAIANGDVAPTKAATKSYGGGGGYSPNQAME